MLEFVFVPHRRVVGLLLCISVGWAPSPFELAFGDEFYPSPFVKDILCVCVFVNGNKKE